MLEVKIKGFAELDKALRELPDKIERNIVRSALRAGAKVIEAEAKAQAPVKDGDLRDSIRSSVRLRRGVPVATIKTDLWRARFIEFGTAQHLISATGKVYKNTRRGEKLLSAASLNYRIEKKVLAIGARILGETVVHPGSRKIPFMRTALDLAAHAAIQAFGAQVKKRLTKEGLNTPDISVDEG